MATWASDIGSCLSDFRDPCETFLPLLSLLEAKIVQTELQDLQGGQMSESILNQVLANVGALS